jgi:hypothetical protein
MAELALEDHDPRKAQEFVRRAMQINPQLVEAWLVTADLAWANFDPALAAKILQEHALPLDPLNEETLGRLAACYAVEGGSPSPSPKGEKSAAAAGLPGSDAGTAGRASSGTQANVLAQVTELREKIQGLGPFH